MQAQSCVSILVHQRGRARHHCIASCRSSIQYIVSLISNMISSQIGAGNLGKSLDPDRGMMRTFISRDAGKSCHLVGLSLGEIVDSSPIGWTWEDLDNSTGTFKYNIGNRGSVIIGAGMTFPSSRRLRSAKLRDFSC